MGMANVGTHDGGWGAGGSRDFDLEALAATSRCCRLYLTHPLSADDVVVMHWRVVVVVVVVESVAPELYVVNWLSLSCVLLTGCCCLTAAELLLLTDGS